MIGEQTIARSMPKISSVEGQLLLERWFGMKIVHCCVTVSQNVLIDTRTNAQITANMHGIYIRSTMQRALHGL